MERYFLYKKTMIAVTKNLMEFLGRPGKFIIPIYQRTYSWINKECNQLWDDILRTGEDEKILSHFIGSVVYIQEGTYQHSNVPCLRVIDGQQRLTTVLLIIEALARYLGETKSLQGFSSKRLRNYYLINPLEEGENRYKLLLTQTDKNSLLSLIDQKPWPKEYSIRIKENFKFFEKKIKELGNDIKPLCEGLKKLIIVDIALDYKQDNPQLIFESMNSTGQELSQADLIRNFILMDLRKEPQEQLYENHWHPMELDFGQEAYSKYFDSFIRDYLTMKTGDLPTKNKVYEAFKRYAQKKEKDALVSDIHTFANYYCSIALDKETNKLLKIAFSDLRELKVNVHYPFLLQIYHDYKQSLLSTDEFEYIVRLVESYIFRRAVCEIPTNILNKTFAKLNHSINKNCYIESVKALFLLLLSRSRFPNNEEFFLRIQRRDLYNFPSRSYWLRKLENYNRKERADVNEYTIEHILPQNKNLSHKWKEALGPEWKKIQEEYLHTLGNLTLTGYNSEYRDKFFTEKRDMEGGFKDSTLRVNEGLSKLETWDKNTIEKRAEKLATKALDVWPAPFLSSEELDKYRPEKQPAEKLNYSIKNYPHLSESNMRLLFDAFQKAVLDLDPCVKEEFRKIYISYKAEKIFVYVIPQKQRLRLFLGLQIYELHDPKKIGKDASHEHFGACDVAVNLNSLEYLPYVMGLVRQALEKQMSNGYE